MEIKQIKEQLNIETLLNHYQLKINPNHHLKCPFHKDNKPSLRIYPETNTYNCFGCGKTGDIVQFIEDYEKINTHEAIQKAKTLIGQTTIQRVEQKKHLQVNYTELFPKFKQSLHRSPKAITYLEERKIYDIKLEMGYNNGLKWKHLKNCIIFPLKNEQGTIVSFYGRSIANTGKHYYTTGRKGLYPEYPKPEIKTLILTESIIDAATILKYTDYEVLAMYGTKRFDK